MFWMFMLGMFTLDFLSSGGGSVPPQHHTNPSAPIVTTNDPAPKTEEELINMVNQTLDPSVTGHGISSAELRFILITIIKSTNHH